MALLNLMKPVFNNNVIAFLPPGGDKTHLDLSELSRIMCSVPDTNTFWKSIFIEVAPWMFYLSDLNAVIVFHKPPTTRKNFSIFTMDMINKAEKGILGITTKIPFCYDTEELREQFRDNGHWMMFIALNAEYRKVQMELCGGKLPSNHAITSMPPGKNVWIITTPPCQRIHPFNLRSRKFTTVQDAADFFLELNNFVFPGTTISVMRYALSFLNYTRFDGLASLSHFMVQMSALCSDYAICPGGVIIFSGNQGSGKSSMLKWLNILGENTVAWVNLGTLKGSYTPFEYERIILLDEFGNRVTPKEINSSGIKQLCQPGSTLQLSIKFHPSGTVNGGHTVAGCADNFTKFGDGAESERRLRNIVCSPNPISFKDNKSNKMAVANIINAIEDPNCDDLKELSQKFFDHLAMLGHFLSRNMHSGGVDPPNIVLNPSHYSKNGLSKPLDPVGYSATPYGHKTTVFTALPNAAIILDQAIITMFVNGSFLPTDNMYKYHYFRLLRCNVDAIFHIYAAELPNIDKEHLKLTRDLIIHLWDYEEPPTTSGVTKTMKKVMEEWTQCITDGLPFGDLQLSNAIEIFRGISYFKAVCNFRSDFNQFPSQLNHPMCMLLLVPWFHLLTHEWKWKEEDYLFDIFGHYFLAQSKRVALDSSMRFSHMILAGTATGFHCTKTVTINLPKSLAKRSVTGQILIKIKSVCGPISSLLFASKCPSLKFPVTQELVEQLSNSVKEKMKDEVVAFDETEFECLQKLLGASPNDSHNVILAHLKSEPRVSPSSQAYYDILRYLTSKFGIFKYSDYKEYTLIIKDRIADFQRTHNELNQTTVLMHLDFAELEMEAEKESFSCTVSDIKEAEHDAKAAAPVATSATVLTELQMCELFGHKPPTAPQPHLRRQLPVVRKQPETRIADGNGTSDESDSDEDTEEIRERKVAKRRKKRDGSIY